MTGASTTGRWAYGILFVVIVPLALAAWAAAAADVASVPVIPEVAWARGH